jgi:hypothetical protein
MKKRLFAILSTVVFTIMLGYLFLLSWLIGFLASKFVAGKSVGEQGRVRSVVIPLKRWGVHLHHWLYSLFLMSLSFTTGMHFLTPEITYGVLGGLVFQGIYCYGDWHVILVSKQQAKVGKRSVNTGKNEIL